MDKARLTMESKILAKHFSNRYFFRDMNTTNPYLDLGLISNMKRTYRLKVEISGFPYKMPRVFISYPTDLRTYNGVLLSTCSPGHSMHTLNPKNHMVQICHYKNQNWNTNVTLYKVVLKTRIWVEGYEAHLRTGEVIDSYVKS